MIFTGERKNIPDTISLSREFFGRAKIAIDAEVKVLCRENQKDMDTCIAELMQIYSSPNLPENNKFPRTCAGIRNLKAGKGRDSMCAIVEEYAEEYAEECVEKRDKETAIHLIKLGKLTAEEIAASIPSLSVEEIIKLQESVLQIS